MLPAFVKHLENSHPGIRLRMVGIKEDSGGVVVEQAIEDAGDQSPEQLKLHTHAHDITFNQIVNHFEKSIDLPALAKQLAELREEMAKRQDPSPQAGIAQGKAEKAEIAANEGNTAKVVEYLKAGGQGLLEIAKETGKELLVAAIKTSMGLS